MATKPTQLNDFDFDPPVEDLVTMLSPECIVQISKRVQDEWSESKRLLPRFLHSGVPDLVPESWAQQKFVTIARDYVREVQKSDVAEQTKRSLSEVSVSSGSDRAPSQKKSRAKSPFRDFKSEVKASLIKAKVLQKDSIEIPVKAAQEQKVTEKINDATQMLTSCAVSEASTKETSPSASATKTSSASADAISKSPKKKTAPMLQLLSPGRHLKQDTMKEEDVTGPLVPLTSVMILGHEATRSVRWSFTGFLVYRGDVRDNAESQKQGTWKQLCEFIVADTTAPVCMTLRDVELTRFLATLDATSASTDFVGFRIDNFRIVPTEASKWNGSVISKMNRIQAVNPTSTTPGTTVRLVAETEVNMCGTGAVQLTPALCISDWDYLPKPIPLPSRLTVAGIIETKDDVISTTPLDGIGKQKCSFTLIDIQGRWLQCSALGFNAEAPALEIGKQVVLWFAVALCARGSECARCAVLNDGVIAPLMEEKTFIPARIAQMLFEE